MTRDGGLSLLQVVEAKHKETEVESIQERLAPGRGTDSVSSWDFVCGYCEITITAWNYVCAAPTAQSM